MAWVLIAFLVGRPFYGLAQKYNRSMIGYAFLGVFTFLGGMLLASLMLLGIFYIWGEKVFANVNQSVIGASPWLLGILGSLALYNHLKQRWQQGDTRHADIIDEIGNATAPPAE